MLDPNKIQEFTLRYLEENLGPLKRSPVQPSEVHFRCPFCTKMDKQGHYYYSLVKCCGFCRRGCHEGHIFDLVRDYGGYTHQQLSELKKGLGYEFTPQSVQRQIEDMRKRMRCQQTDAQATRASLRPLNIPIPDDLDSITPSRFPAYLKERGVAPRDLADLQLQVKMGARDSVYRWTNEDGEERVKKLSGYLCFPLECGYHRSFEAYRTYESEYAPKTWFPPPANPGDSLISTTDLLFLYERFKHSPILTLVEGIFDALTIARLGLAVSALLSNKISAYQCTLLARLLKLQEIVVSLDADTQAPVRGGLSQEQKVLTTLRHYTSCRISIVRLDEGDPDEADPDDYLARWKSRQLVKP